MTVFSIQRAQPQKLIASFALINVPSVLFASITFEVSDWLRTGKKLIFSGLSLNLQPSRKLLSDFNVHL